MTLEVFIGWDPRQDRAWQVAARSAVKHSSIDLDVRPLIDSHLRALDKFDRPVIRDNGVLWDVPSEHPAATEFAMTRFLVPSLSRGEWALFVDCDVLFRADLAELLKFRDPSKAVMVVKHEYEPLAKIKMDGQTQSTYGRKNWSSLMLFNCRHPKHELLTKEKLGCRPGRELHQFCWLEDEDIGDLPLAWNWLEGEAHCNGVEPKMVHFTNGIPNVPGHVTCDFAVEWWRVARQLEVERLR